MVRGAVNRTHAGDRVVQDIQTELADAVDNINEIRILDGVQLTDVVLSASDTLVNHKLGRVPIGWVITDKNAAETVFRNADYDSSHLTLQASGAVTVGIWVY